VQVFTRNVTGIPLLVKWRHC